MEKGTTNRKPMGVNANRYITRCHCGACCHCSIVQGFDWLNCRYFVLLLQQHNQPRESARNRVNARCNDNGLGCLEPHQSHAKHRHCTQPTAGTTPQARATAYTVPYNDYRGKVVAR